MADRKVVEYLERGISPFGIWFSKLDPHVAAKISTALYRLEAGNVSNVKSVGKGVFEYKIDFGPGFRIYFGHEGDRLFILLGGGVKKTQNKDIKIAQMRWAHYKVTKEK